MYMYMHTYMCVYMPFECEKVKGISTLRRLDAGP